MLTDGQLALLRAIDAQDEAASIAALTNLDNINFMVNLGFDKGLIPCVSYIIQHAMNDLLACALDKETDLRAKDSKFGNTPLHWAAMVNPAAVKLLVKQGADKRALNMQNQKPVHLLASDASTQEKRILSPIPSLQEITSLFLALNPQELPSHLMETQATFVQNYRTYQAQYQANQQQMYELSNVTRSLTFLNPS